MEKSLNDFIIESKNDSMFEFIQDIKIKESLYLFFGYVSLYFDEILADNLEENLKELKAHTILVYIGSIVDQ